MFASEGLQFDDIPSSEDESSKKGKYLSCSDTSTDSDSMAGSIPIINDQEYISMINKKKLVMNQIKQSVTFKNSSDSEREIEINQEIEDLDCWYGITPPREIRRHKHKGKDFNKFCNNTSLKKPEKKPLHVSSLSKEWQKDRENQRKERVREKKNKEEFVKMDMLEPCDTGVPRTTKLVRVNSTKGLKSICQQKHISSSKLDDISSITPSVATKAIHINKKKDSSSFSRAHFHKSFALLVKLGGHIPSHYKSFDQHLSHGTDDEHCQVEFQELLWLELQAWHHGQIIEDHDNFLQESRTKVESVLDDVINYKFDDSVHDQLDPDMNLTDNSSDDSAEFLSFECVDGMTTSSPIKEDSPVASIKLDSVPDVASIDIPDIGFSLVEPLLKDTGQTNGESTTEENAFHQNNEEFAKAKVKQIKAMHSIMEILKKVDGIERLYPNRKALTLDHPKYKDVKFVRNLEAMLLWLSISKDMFHKLYLLADFIDIDPDDMITWNDWFDIGLDGHCLKTNQCYQNQHWLSTSDTLESSGNLSTLSNSYAIRRSKRDKRKRISLNRMSLVEKTGTSRYRHFVERGIRKDGLLGLIKRVKDIISTTLWNSRFVLSDKQTGVDYSFSGPGEMNLTSYEDVRKVMHLLKMHSGSTIDLLSNMESPVNDGSKSAKAIQEMCLPSFLYNYLFLTKVPFDIVHECIRFRFDYKPKVEPSEHSIRQLIKECKEVVSGGILVKYFFQEMSLAVLDIGDTEKLKSVEKALEEFDNDLKSMLNLYFEYLQSWFSMLQNFKQASANLTNVIEDEWNFSKEICYHVQGGETRAGYKFCVLVSDLLKSTGQFLENSVDECFSTYNPNEQDDVSQRQKMLSACREYKQIFREVRGRAAKGLGYAKLLQKDLGIAAGYGITSSFEHVLNQLKHSGHALLEYSYSKYFILVPQCLMKKKRECIQLISLTCGYESAEENNFYLGRYILFLRKPKERIIWTGRRVNFGISTEVTLALSYVDTVDGLTLVCKNAYHLNTQRKDLEKLLGDSIKIKIEQTSSHGILEKSLHDMKESAKKLANIIATAIHHVDENLNLNAASDMDEADHNSTQKSCIETMHSCFSVGFEYLREMVRLFHGLKRIELGPFVLDFSRKWMDFVLTRTERGHGTRPRWAAQGMEFLITATDPKNIDNLSEEEFKILKLKMHDCITHIVGNAEPKHKRKLREARSSSPFSVHRSRSVPAQINRKNDTDADLSDGPAKALTLPADFNGSRTQSLKSITNSDQNSSSAASVASDSDTLDSISNIIEEDEEVEAEANDIPIIRVRSALQEIDERRTAKLQYMRVIGSVTNKQANFASQLVHMNVRKVNFKWQLGNKIGEGQFGKVYSAVNLDTCELMAVKQIRFNPHDYGTIQDIADEITNIQAVQHDSLVRYYGVEVHKDEMLIFMENCQDGTIAEVAKLGLPESMIRVYTYQITKAINFLHQNGIIHRDIKGANIFLSSSGLIKIGDFGSAVKLKDPMCTTVGELFNTRGTAAFMAPEVITLDKGKGYGRAADIWSLGCVVIEMASGKQPWSEYDNIYAIMYKVGDGQHPTIPETLSKEGEHFLKHCFIRDANERWTAHMLEDHPFIKCC